MSLGCLQLLMMLLAGIRLSPQLQLLLSVLYQILGASHLLLCCLQEQAASMFTLQLGTAECRQQLFALDEQFPHYLNHGSYGATFRCDCCQWANLCRV
jgi:hypothetical protein